VIAALVLAGILPFLPAAADSNGCPLALRDATPLQVAMRLAQLGVVRWGCEDGGVVTATWSRPTEGSPVVVYQIEIEAAATWPDTTFRIPVPVAADSLRGRVRGVDAQGRAGPWSVWCGWYPVGN